MTGSGIYAGEQGALVSVMVSDEGERKLYKARVPKKGSKYIPESTNVLNKKPRDVTNLRLLKDPQIQNYSSLLIDITAQEKDIKTKLCDEDVCCAYEIKAKIINDTLGMNYRYRVGVFDGRRTYEKEEWSDIKVCGLYACKNANISSCGEALLAENVLFKKINIKGEFPEANKLLIMPSILDDQLYPLQHDTVMFSKRKRYQNYEVELKLNKEQTNIMTFAIYGQYYEKKSTSMGVKAGNNLIVTLVLLSLVGFVNMQ